MRASPCGVEATAAKYLAAEASDELSLPSVIYVMGHAMLSEFTPVPQRGAMLAITNSVWTGAATAAEGYQQGFVLCGVVTLIGGLIGLVFLRPGTEVSRFAPRHGSVLAPAG